MSKRLRYVAVVEVPDLPESDLPARLFQSAYEASRLGPVALLVTADGQRAVDRALDPLVSADRLVHGIRYSNATDDACWERVSANTVVIASSSDARRRANSAGVPCLDPASGLAALDRLVPTRG
jgi:hypothetical protein